MIEDRHHKHRNKPNRMSDAEIMVILILFHSGGFRCFKHYYKEYVCKHLTHFFPKRVSYYRITTHYKTVVLIQAEHVFFEDKGRNFLNIEKHG